MRRRLALMTTAPSELSNVESELDLLVQSVTPAKPVQHELADVGTDEIGVGNTVWVPDLNATGEVLALDGQAAEVQVGSFRVRARRASLELRHKAAAQPSDERGTEISTPPAPAVSLELQLRGLRVDEALRRVEKYLDDAYRAQAPFVRIVHGKGTGALRKAVRGFLRGHPLVESFRSGAEGEGDTGVTVVKFASS
jgi:DNA mismatch repair protein MutS2